MKIGLVCTTVNNGEFLRGYCNQIEKEGLRDDVTIYVIPDEKTPRELYDECIRQSELGFKIFFPYINEQDTFLKKVNFNLVPHNSDNRRNIGYLMALKDGCEIIISIDDDNHCGENFFTEHSVVGKEIN